MCCLPRPVFLCWVCWPGQLWADGGCPLLAMLWVLGCIGVLVVLPVEVPGATVGWSGWCPLWYLSPDLQGWVHWLTSVLALLPPSCWGWAMRWLPKDIPGERWRGWGLSQLGGHPWHGGGSLLCYTLSGYHQHLLGKAGAGQPDGFCPSMGAAGHPGTEVTAQ